MLGFLTKVDNLVSLMPELSDRFVRCKLPYNSKTTTERVSVNIADVERMGILDLIFAAREGQFPEAQSLAPEKDATKVQRGVINSLAARNLIGARQVLADIGLKVAQEHRALHQQKEGSSSHECDRFHGRVRSLTEKLRLIEGLLWGEVSLEYPSALVCDCSINEGFTLSSGDEWIQDPFVAGWVNPYVMFCLRLAKICRGEVESYDPETIKDELSAIEQGEEVVGIITDTRVRALFELQSILLQEVRDTLLPRLERYIDLEDWSKLSVGESRQIMNSMSVVERLQGLARTLFWQAVRDSVSASASLPHIGVREGFQVVKCVDSPDEGTLVLDLVFMGSRR